MRKPAKKKPAKKTLVLGRTCSFCGAPYIGGKGGAKGLCARHYRQQRNGEELRLEKLTGPAQETQPLTVRLPPALHAKVHAHAEREEISVSRAVVEALHAMLG